MTGVVSHQGSRGVAVVVGVDTHQDEHVAVAIDQQGVRLAERYAPATSYGYGELERWSRAWEKFAPSESKAPVPTAPDWPGS